MKYYYINENSHGNGNTRNIYFIIEEDYDLVQHLGKVIYSESDNFLKNHAYRFWKAYSFIVKDEQMINKPNKLMVFE